MQYIHKNLFHKFCYMHKCIFSLSLFNLCVGKTTSKIKYCATQLLHVIYTRGFTTFTTKKYLNYVTTLWLKNKFLFKKKLTLMDEKGMGAHKYKNIMKQENEKKKIHFGRQQLSFSLVMGIAPPSPNFLAQLAK